MIALLDILQARQIPFGKFKIHLATNEKNPPLDAFFNQTFKQWQEEQNALNFKCEHIVSLISLNKEMDLWLFAGVYQVLGVGKGTSTPYLYKTTLLPNQEDLIGRVIVRYKRTFRNSYIWGNKYGHLLEVAEIRSQRMSVRDFPGYNNVIISYRELRLIITQQDTSWKSALSNVMGIYLIADRDNGKFYVGKADGIGGIWSRWEEYVKTQHGGNKRLKEIINNHGIHYAENFQFSILEIADMNTPIESFDARESYWKKALLSSEQEHGYNLN